MLVPRSLRTKAPANAPPPPSTRVHVTQLPDDRLPELTESSTEPSAASGTSKGGEFCVGNYAFYYGRRRRSDRGLGIDGRLSRVPVSELRGRRVLDVGCNAGEVALGVAAVFGPAHVEGVDIDPKLVVKANAALAQAASKVGPDGVLDYFPTTAPTLLGPLPIVHAPPETGFPHNVSFRLSNFLTDPVPTNQEDKFDTVLALSITKWIHVRYGDAGLKLFFQKCWSVLRKGGALILEPQSWEGGRGYDKAVRKNESVGLYPTYVSAAKKARLKLRPEDFPTYLVEEIGFASCERLGMSPNSAPGFKRDMYLFRK
ncbi:hypothetical protein HDU79_011782 [Rhizoclosmatium sp. JEL0117]|nr:hypothetical protein HDU79_011782 [Rhizoclosmatium sp. JEL0117]